MAARKLRRGMPFHPDEVRAKIRAMDIVHNLQEHILGNLEMSVSQVRAAIALLRKCVPDLISSEIKADITHRYVAQLPDVLTREEWEKKYGSDHLQPTIQ